MIEKMGFIRNKLAEYVWDLAIGHYDENIVSNGVDWTELKYIRNPYKKKWFADPFILDENSENIQLLVEEFDSDINKGRIARITISKENYTIVDCTIILELDTHLSFPVIYRIADDVYVHPENSASGKSTIYRYDEQQDKLVEPVVLVNEPLVDAAIVRKEGAYFMYSTLLSQNSGPELHVFQSQSLTQPFIKCDVLDFGKRTARMAGALLETSQGLIRPAQDCTHDYGEAVLFYSGMDLVGEIRPVSNGKYAGTHTFNILNDTFVVDLKRYKYYYIRNLANKFLKK